LNGLQECENDDQLVDHMVFDDEGYKDDDSDIGEEELIKRIAS
jgi:hypothetical protein